MTPTPILLLTVAVFWTLPASAAAYAYRRNGGTLASLATDLKRAGRRLTAPELRPQPDA
jgi:hypothetical protein